MSVDTDALVTMALQHFMRASADPLDVHLVVDGNYTRPATKQEQEMRDTILALAAELNRLRSERDDYRDTSAAKQHAVEELKRQLESVEKFLASPPGPDYYPAGIHWMRDQPLEDAPE